MMLEGQIGVCKIERKGPDLRPQEEDKRRCIIESKGMTEFSGQIIMFSINFFAFYKPSTVPEIKQKMLVKRGPSVV